MVQLNIVVPVKMKADIKKEAREAGMMLSPYVEKILAERHNHSSETAEEEAGSSNARGSSKPPPPEPPPSPFETKKQARLAWDAQFKRLPTDMRDAWKEENPRP